MYVNTSLREITEMDFDFVEWDSEDDPRELNDEQVRFHPSIGAEIRKQRPAVVLNPDGTGKFGDDATPLAPDCLSHFRA